MLLEVYYKEAIQSQCLLPTLYVNHVYIRCTYNTCIQYRRPLPYGRIDLPRVVKIVYIMLYAPGADLEFKTTPTFALTSPTLLQTCRQ